MGWAAEASLVVRRIADPSSRSNRLLVIGLGIIPLAMSLVSLADILRGYPVAVDLAIPLDAASRWLVGGEPYLAESFSSSVHPPFLYPPYALVLYAPLTTIARDLVFAGSVAVSLAFGVVSLRRLGIPMWLVPVVLTWPPFAEALIGGNVQIVLFAGFVFALAGSAGDQRRSSATRGLWAATVAFLKVSQAHVFAYFARRDRVAVAVAVTAVAALALVTLPLTGLGLWQDWFAQLRRASDPEWFMVGSSVARLFSPPFDAAFVVVCLAAALVVPRDRAAEWVGVLLVLGSPGLRTYYFLFFLPAMLRMRREAALAAAFFLATYTHAGWWLGIALVVASLVVSTIRDRRVGQPGTSGDGSTRNRTTASPSTPPSEVSSRTVA